MGEQRLVESVEQRLRRVVSREPRAGQRQLPAGAATVKCERCSTDRTGKGDGCAEQFSRRRGCPGGQCGGALTPTRRRRRGGAAGTSGLQRGEAARLGCVAQSIAVSTGHRPATAGGSASERGATRCCSRVTG